MTTVYVCTCVCVSCPQRGSATSYRAKAQASHSRRRQSLMPGLPEWGRDLPDNVSRRGMDHAGRVGQY